MATIKEGYNAEPLHIRLSHSNHAKHAELWLKQEGLPEIPEIQKYRETLSYISLDELIILRDEINSVIKEITGV